jgi:hypothetical protein
MQMAVRDNLAPAADLIKSKLQQRRTGSRPAKNLDRLVPGDDGAAAALPPSGIEDDGGDSAGAEISLPSPWAIALTIESAGELPLDSRAAGSVDAGDIAARS